jgi:hypothetical protein
MICTGGAHFGLLLYFFAAATAVVMMLAGYLVGCSIVAVLAAFASYTWFWVRNRRTTEVV